MLKRIPLILALLYAFFPPPALNGAESTSGVRQAVVKIVNTVVRPNYYTPWRMNDSSTYIGSGAIIGDNLILTNAHIVADSAYLQVQKENDPALYDAAILFMGHDCDLALITVKERGFFKGTSRLQLGGIPELQSKVTTYGYPEGGEKISITEGIVSRIEVGTYSHSGKSGFLMIQTDAAINPGNSGGPVMQDRKVVGVAFQTRSDSSNIGFMIPVPVISHFLKDVRDGSYDGFPSLGIIIQEVQNRSYREFLGMKESQSGILVTHVIPQGSADKHLNPGDIILGIDSVPIANDGSFPFHGGRVRFSHIIDKKHIGDTISVTILRKGETVTQRFRLKQMPVRIPWYNEFNTRPRYFILGGVVFQTLGREYLKIWSDWWTNANDKLLYLYHYHDADNLEPERKEFVLINHVLPDPANTYVSYITDRVVDEINGMKILCLEDAVKAAKRPIGKFHVIKTAGTHMPIVLDAGSIEDADRRIMKNYNIRSILELE